MCKIKKYWPDITFYLWVSLFIAFLIQMGVWVYRNERMLLDIKAHRPTVAYTLPMEKWDTIEIAKKYGYELRYNEDTDSYYFKLK